MILMYIAMSKDGLSKPSIHESNGSIDSKVYINKYLRPVLVPFISEWYNDHNYVFWPDLASCHYWHETIEYLNSQNIIYVPKDDNPPNVP